MYSLTNDMQWDYVLDLRFLQGAGCDSGHLQVKSDQDTIYINEINLSQNCQGLNVSNLKDEAKFKGYKKSLMHNWDISLVETEEKI